MEWPEDHHLYSVDGDQDRSEYGAFHSEDQSLYRLGEYQNYGFYRLGRCEKRHFHCLGEHFHECDYGGGHAVFQPVYGMGGHEERCQHCLGRHQIHGNDRMGGHLRFLRGDLGFHYRQDRHIDPAGQYQHGFCMGERGQRGGVSMERDV